MTTESLSRVSGLIPSSEPNRVNKRSPNTRTTRKLLLSAKDTLHFIARLVFCISSGEAMDRSSIHFGPAHHCHSSQHSAVWISVTTEVNSGSLLSGARSHQLLNTDGCH